MKVPGIVSDLETIFQANLDAANETAHSMGNEAVTRAESQREIIEKILKLNVEELEHMKALLKNSVPVMNNLSISLNCTVDSMRLAVLQELSGETYDALLSAALLAKPVSSRVRPQSLQMIIATTWRSGSTFLMELLNSLPGVYNHYEPLTPFGLKVLKAGPEGEQAVNLITDLLKCRYSDSDYMSTAHRITELISRNTRLWKACRNKDNKNALCFDKDFLEAACSIFPWTLMKIVRIRLRLLQPLMEDTSLNTHIIYLVRDPRAVINSRTSTVQWCHTNDCSDPHALCDNMEDDLRAVMEFHSRYPGRVHLVRYEDMALAPRNETRRLLDEIGLEYDSAVESFIDTHTSKNYDQPWTTMRESAKRVTYWTTKLPPNILHNVQATCADVLPKFGYLAVQSSLDATVNDILGPSPFRDVGRLS